MEHVFSSVTWENTKCQSSLKEDMLVTSAISHEIATLNRYCKYPEILKRSVNETRSMNA